MKLNFFILQPIPDVITDEDERSFDNIQIDF